MAIDANVTERYGPMPFELLEPEGASNVRDLGGYVGLDGMRIMPRRFVRAGSLAGLTDAGLDELARIGVDCTIDLRSRYEAEKMPSRAAADRRFAYRHVPMLDYINSSVAAGVTDFSDFPSSMGEMYIGLLDHAGGSFREVFSHLADPAYSCCLFHCTAGKDRTGMTAMLLLKLAGVDDETVIEDYRWSERLLDAPPTSYSPSVPNYVLESAPDTMRRAIDHLDERYGGAEAYLEQIGVNAEMRRRMRDKLFQA